MMKENLYKLKKDLETKKPGIIEHKLKFKKGELVREDETSVYGYVKFCSLSSCEKHLWVDRGDVKSLFAVV